jgi:hypothetical protein
MLLVRSFSPTLFYTPSGSCHVQRFRSPAEFAPHAVWLLHDLSLKNCNCLCKYCSKRPARSVKHTKPTISGPIAPPSSSRTQHISRTSSHLTQTSRISLGKEAERLFRLVRVPVVLGLSDLQPQSFEINRDLPYREGEIVWLILDNPLTGGKGWCPDPVHRKYIARKWTKDLANTHPEHFKDIQNFPSQFN